MIEAEELSAAEEKALLDEWFATVQFDHPSEGIPELDPENDDEESRALSSVEFDDLMEELRKRDPDNPF